LSIVDARVYVDYGDTGIADDCVMTTRSAYVTAFYQSRDRSSVACSNGSMTSSSRVHVLSVTGSSRGDDVRRRLPRIRVNIVSAAAAAAGNISAGQLRLQRFELRFKIDVKHKQTTKLFMSYHNYLISKL